MTRTATREKQVDGIALEQKVKAMYRAVALQPEGEFHFEMGRALAERLGYVPADLDAIPPQAIQSFAGVGYYFDLARIEPGETVVDLGSGSGMDSFIAALKVGVAGKVVGVEMTDEQLDKAQTLRLAAGVANVSYRKAYIQDTGPRSMRPRPTELLAAAPVARLTTLVRQRDDPNLLRLELIDDAVREATKGKSPRATAPNRAKSGVVKEKPKGALELGNECESQFSVGFSRVEEGSVNQL